MLLTPDWPVPHCIGALTTLRSGGVSLTPYDGSGSGGLNLGDHVGDRIEHVLSNRALLADQLPSQPQWLSQVHSATVLNLDNAPDSFVADAVVTTRPNVVCAILTADCLPVLFCDPQHGVVAAAHAGWRGLAKGVLENTIAAMQTAGANPANILAWLGPAIGPSKFEVGEDVRACFTEAEAFTASSTQPGKFYADIFQLARCRMQKTGVHQIFGGQFCTFSQPEKFYSYRRDGVTGRMASLIWLR